MANTEPKLELSDKERIRNRIDNLFSTERTNLKKANRRNLYINGGIIVFNIIIAIFGYMQKGAEGIVFPLFSSFWLGAIWFLENSMNSQRFVINTLTGLRAVENEELERSLKETEEAIAKATVKPRKAKATA